MSAGEAVARVRADGTIARVVGRDFASRIEPTGEIFTLSWTDYVANDWTEEYVFLSTAMARLALLIACGEGDWFPSFREEPDEFSDHWRDFSRMQLSEPT